MLTIVFVRSDVNRSYVFFYSVILIAMFVVFVSSKCKRTGIVLLLDIQTSFVVAHTVRNILILTMGLLLEHPLSFVKCSDPLMMNKVVEFSFKVFKDIR